MMMPVRVMIVAFAALRSVPFVRARRAAVHEEIR
jgi:hypothetical protein